LTAPLAWQEATVVAIEEETATAKTFRLRLAGPADHLAGQHYILRLTAPDGYQAQRSYSVASAPDGSPFIDLTIERLPEGEVSTFMHDVVVVGDLLEVRGPIGGWFVWQADRPALLVGGGSGVVPLMAMLRYARLRQAADLVRLIVSVRRPEDLYYANELPGAESTVIYTRVVPDGSVRPPGRLSPQDLRPILTPDATAYICGSSPFADAATDAVADCGVAVERIRIERFGPTG
jgi:ferredoxin-NADP reductase